MYVLLDGRISIGRHRFGQVRSHQGGSSGGRRDFRHRRVSKVSLFFSPQPQRNRREILIFLFAFSSISRNRKSIELRGIDRSSKDDKYFRIRELNSSRIQIILKESLDELVDNDTPHNILKFKIQCNSALGNRRNHDVRLRNLWIYD